jgi:hypothetical protein
MDLLLPLESVKLDGAGDDGIFIKLLDESSLGQDVGRLPGHAGEPQTILGCGVDRTS